jgi:hypothetical protein
MTARETSGHLETLRGEDRLCLALARGTFGPEPRAAAEALLSSTLDWTLVLDRLRAQDVAPLACRNLASLGWRAVPPEARQALEAGQRMNALRNDLLMDDLASVLRLLHATRVPAIPLKGPMLADALYGDAALRSSSDLDLLVPRADVGRAWPLLEAAGWQPAEAYRVAPYDLGLLVESNIEYAFARHRGEFLSILELHWDIAWRWQRDSRAAADLWAAARPANVRGEACMTLGDPWQFVYLATHAARHRWQGLKWIVDIHELASRTSLDWDEVVRIAGSLELTRIVRLSLSVCRALYGTPLPGALPPMPLPRWLSLYPEAPVPAGMWNNALLPSRLLDGPGARLGYLARVLLRPTLAERRLLPLPASLVPLYYALRPLRLGCRFTSGAARAGIRRLAGVAS